MQVFSNKLISTPGKNETLLCDIPIRRHNSVFYQRWTGWYAGLEMNHGNVSDGWKKCSIFYANHSWAQMDAWFWWSVMNHSDCWATSLRPRSDSFICKNRRDKNPQPLLAVREICKSGWRWSMYAVVCALTTVVYTLNLSALSTANGFLLD